MDEGKLDAELVGDGGHPIPLLAACAMGCRAHTPLRTTRIRRHYDTVPPIRDVALDVRDEQRLRIQVVDRNVEEALDLARMQVHRDDMVRARGGEHVRDELRGDRRARGVLLVHTRVGEGGDDGGDAARGGGLARGDEDEKLHQVVVDIPAAGLEDEDVLVADGLGDLDVDLAVGELLDGAGDEGDVEPGHDR